MIIVSPYIFDIIDSFLLSYTCIGLHVKKRIHSMPGSSSSNYRGFLANGVGTACRYHCYVNQVHGKGKGNKRLMYFVFNILQWLICIFGDVS